MKELREAIALKGTIISELTGGLWYLEAPSDVVEPYAVFSFLPANYSRDSANKFQEHFLQINVYSKSCTEAENVAEAIINSFDDSEETFVMKSYIVNSIDKMLYRNSKVDDIYQFTLQYKIDLTEGYMKNGIIYLSYNSLNELVKAKKIVPGVKYCIDDYQTGYKIDEVQQFGSVEPIVVTALTNEEFEPIAYSQLHPKDILYYTFNGDESFYGSVKGYITRRIDTIRNNDIGFDWRQIKFRRYKVKAPLYNSSMVYSKGACVRKSYWDGHIYLYISLVDGNENNPVTDVNYWRNTYIDNESYICPEKTDFWSIVDGTIMANILGYEDKYIVPDVESIGFYDNKIVYNNYEHMNYNYYNTVSLSSSFHGNKINGKFYNNTMIDGFIDNRINGDFYNNVIKGGFQDTFIDGISSNNFFYTFTGNTVKSNISSCVFTINNYNLYAGTIQGCNFYNRFEKNQVFCFLGFTTFKAYNANKILINNGSGTLIAYYFNSNNEQIIQTDNF